MRSDARVVITGLGCIAPNGVGVPEFWRNLSAGVSGIREITAFDHRAHGRHMGGQIVDFDAEKVLGAELAARTGRASQLAIAAGREALRHAGLEDAPRGGLVVVGSTMADVAEFEKINDDWHEGGLGAINRTRIHLSDASGFGSRVARSLVPGARMTFVANACAAGNAAVGMAALAVRNGDAPYAIAGGADPISRIAFAGFARIGGMSPDRCRPFDRDRKGMLAAEGAGMIIIERLDTALRRGAVPLAEIAGFALGCDAHHITSPRPDGRELANTLRRLLETSGVRAEDVGYVGAHGTGTQANDVAESRAIREGFGAIGATVPVTSIKSMIGHTMGAASALQLIACVLSIRDGLIPPTINLENLDPECKINVVGNSAMRTEVNAAIASASAFGGNNAAVMVKRVRP